MSRIGSGLDFNMVFARGGVVMAELKPCPFCGNDTQNYFRYSFKKDRKKRFGIYYDICEIYCTCCTASIRQAGAGRERAQEFAEKRWNERVDNG